MPKAYLVAHIRIHDKGGFEKFSAMAGLAIAKYGGKVLARNPVPDHYEGDLRGATLIQLVNMAAARKFYESDAYANEANDTGKLRYAEILGPMVRRDQR